MSEESLSGKKMTPLEKEIIKIIGGLPQLKGRPITGEDGIYIRRLADFILERENKLKESNHA